MTLKKIADRAHVSVSTVSRALSDSYEVSNETREDVLRIAKEVGYFEEKKRIKAGYKRAGRVRAVILCPELISIHYSLIASAFVDAFAARGSFASVYTYSFNPVLRDEMIAKCFDDSSVDAVILMEEVHGLLPQNLNVPVAVVGPCGREDVISFFLNSSTGFSEVADYCLKTGKTRVAFAGEKLTSINQNKFAAAMTSHGITPCDLFVSGNRFCDAGHDAAAHFAKALPHLIVCAYDEIAMGLIEGLTSLGIRVPEDVEVVGNNDVPTAKYCFGGLTTLHYDDGEVLLSIVDDILENRRNVRYEIPSRLIFRHTTGT